MILKKGKTHLLLHGSTLYQSDFIHIKSAPSTTEVGYTLGFNFFVFCGINKIPGHTASISIKWVHVQRTTEIRVCALPQWKAGTSLWDLGLSSTSLLCTQRQHSTKTNETITSLPPLCDVL